MSNPNDPAAFFRDMLGQWEKFAGPSGGEPGKPGDFADTLKNAGAATMAAQAGLRQVVERTLSAANVPSRDDLAEIAARLGRVEAALFRIEARLIDLAGAPAKDEPAA